jgi:ParB family transcriptional regulator, chromosome partitioning protein
MAELKIDYISASDLVPYENNSRTHSKEQVEQIKRSITEFGFTNPILIDEHNGIIAGHGRLRAAQELGIDTVPTILLEGLTEAQRKAYVIADNKLALNASWNMELLLDEISTLRAEDFDIDLLGFDLSELEIEDLDYGLLDDIEIDESLEPEHYEEAQGLIKYWREQGGYIGLMLINHLRDEKQK